MAKARPRKFAGVTTLTGSKGQDVNMPKKAIEALKLTKGTVFKVYVEEGERIVYEVEERPS